MSSIDMIPPEMAIKRSPPAAGLLYSASSTRAAEIGRQQIEAHYHKALTAALPGRYAAQRAALVLAMVAGVQVMRQMIGLSALTTCPPALLVRILGPVFQELMDGQRRRSPAPASSR
jgi:hypothetical protein